MKRFFLTKEQFDNNIVNDEEFNHMIRVLRMAINDEFIAILDDAFDYKCKITDIKKDYLCFDVVSKTKNAGNPEIKIDVCQALAKGDKMELIAQKLTEIGVSTIYPLFVKNCDVKMNSSKPFRLEKIIIGACKQCGRSVLTKVTPIQQIKDIKQISKNYDLIIFANETEQNDRLFSCLENNKVAKSVLIIVGPEGGFTPNEIEQISTFAVSVSLGKRILRTETAAIYLSSIVSEYYGN